ncbi:MAG: Hpt domain-containing protein [Gemmatimonadota bacterium]|nr:Hpt domain-containing protein [Gemmatimonadota bacterium]
MTEEHTSPPVDLNGFRQAMREAGIEEIVDQTLRVFLTEAPQHHTNLEQACTGDDPDAIAKAAHGFKSAASAIYAYELADLLKKAELMGKEGNGDGAKGIFETIGNEYKVVMQYLNDHIADDQ